MATDAPGPTRTIDFGRCFTFVTEDPDWLTKILVGGLFMLLSAVLVGIPFVLGYWARTLKNVAAGKPRPLPQWDDLGGIFSEGLRLVGVYLVYAIGLALVLGLVCGVVIVPFIALGASGAVDEGTEGLFAALGGLGTLVLWAVIMLGSLAAMVYLPAAMTRSALRDSFSEGFAFREIARFIQANLGNYALTIVVYLVASFVSQFGAILCCVGVFPAAFWAYEILAYALGETVRLNPTSI
jgi:hypothetical protein